MKATYEDGHDISIAWNPPDTPNGDLTGYILHIDVAGEDDYKEFPLPASPCTFDHTNLVPNTPYRFQLTAVNSKGEGPPSAILNVSTEELQIKARSTSSSEPPKERKAVSAHKLRSIKGVYLPPPSTHEPSAATASPMRPAGISGAKKVWKPRVKTPEPEPAPEPAKSITNPHALGAAAAKRRMSMADKHAKTLEVSSEEHMLRAMTLKRTPGREVVGNSHHSKGAAVPIVARRQSAREFWKTKLDAKDSLNVAVDVDGSDLFRLVPAGELMKEEGGAVRGKKNTVRKALGMYQPLQSKFESELLEQLYHAEKDGTIVIYTTSLEAIRKTRDDCTQMLKLFELLNLKARVKDVHLEPKFGKELEERSRTPAEAQLPRLFINAVHIGGLDEVVRMNDNGDLKRATIGFPERSKIHCADCNSFGFVLCSWCQGSMKSRSHNFHEDPRKSALKCTVCNENGLVQCTKCP